MKLKEKSEQLFDKINNCIPIEASFTDTAEQASDKISKDYLATTKIVEIAEDFAICFTEWLMDNCTLSEDRSLYSYESEDYTNARLLKIYKKEKGL